ncbi:MAG: glycosyltransferase, partial [Caulobacterales bacterium]|nr:glycosyltransferase [Caulobacterales bacterium]
SENLETAKAEKRKIAKSENHIIKTIYLGDARDEKNFGLLPGVLDRLHSSKVGRGKVEFGFQSNFNTEKGEPKSAKARLELSSMPEDYCKLMGGPFSSNEYREILESCDVVLIPYDPHLYAARSSGIMAEALAFGKPMVTTGGSWMAQILEPLRQSYLEGLETQMSKNGKFGKNLSVIERCSNFKTFFGTIVERTKIKTGATHIMFNIKISRTTRNDFLRLAFNFGSANFEKLGTVEEIILLDRCDLKILVRIPENACEVSIDLSYLDPGVTFIIEKIEMNYIKAKWGIPASFLGVICGGSEFDFAHKLEEVLENIVDYKHHASTTMRYWSEYHAINNLIIQLVDFDKSRFLDHDLLAKIAFEAGRENA